MDQFIDIIFLALVAAFVLWRLREVLGEKRGRQRDDQPEPRDDLSADADEAIIQAPYRKITHGQEPDMPNPLAEQLDAISSVDRSFDLDDFMEGATKAYEIILKAFALGDKNALRPLVSKDIFKTFSAAMDDRMAQGHMLDLTLERVAQVTLEDAQLDDSEISLTVRFVSERTEVLYDKKKTVIQGDPDALETVHDLWTFMRRVDAKDPNWMLIATARDEAEKE